MTQNTVDRRKLIGVIGFALFIGLIVAVGAVLWLNQHERAGIAVDNAHRPTDFVERDFVVDDARLVEYCTRGNGHMATYFLIRPQGSDILLRATMPTRPEASGLMYLGAGENMRVRVLQADLDAAQNRHWYDRLLDIPLGNASRMVPLYRLESDGRVMFARPDNQPNATMRYAHISERAMLAYVLIPLFLIAIAIGAWRRRRHAEA